MAGAVIGRFIGTLLGEGILTSREIGAARISAGIVAETEEAEGAVRLIDLPDEAQQPITLPVSSTAIASIGWDPIGVIIVEFHRGGAVTYTYDGTFELFTAFALSSSKGKFFNEHFK